MKYRSNMTKAAVLLLTFALIACGDSVVNSNGSNNDVGFDPTKNTNLKTIHFDALQQRLLVTFGLANNGTSMIYLNQSQNKTTFANPSQIYNSTYATSYINLMSKACEEVASDNVLFPSGAAKIDEVWKKITGQEADDSARALEKDLLAKTSGQPDDIKKFALCLGTATSAQATFTNYVAK